MEKRAERAARLSAARATAARSMELAVQAELASLSMGGTTLRMELVRLPTIGAKGADMILGRSPPSPVLTATI